MEPLLAYPELLLQNVAKITILAFQTAKEDAPAHSLEYGSFARPQIAAVERSVQSAKGRHSRFYKNEQFACSKKMNPKNDT